LAWDSDLEERAGESANAAKSGDRSDLAIESDGVCPYPGTAIQKPAELTKADNSTRTVDDVRDAVMVGTPHTEYCLLLSGLIQWST
jgi:hypothetical protein